MKKVIAAAIVLAFGGSALLWAQAQGQHPIGAFLYSLGPNVQGTGGLVCTNGQVPNAQTGAAPICASNSPTYPDQVANTVLAGPTTPPNGQPAFRALVPADIPSLPFSQITGTLASTQLGTATITALTNKAAPDPVNDFVIIYDQAGNAVKKASVGSISAAKTFGYATTTLTGNYTPTSADQNKILYADATSTTIDITMPTAASFGIGLLGVKKIDLTSNPVALIGANLENGMTRIEVALEGDAQIYASNGSIWKQISPGLGNSRHQTPLAEHTVTTLTYQATLQYNNYILLVDTATAGGPVQVVLPTISVVVPAGTHQTYNICVNKFDGSANVVSVTPQAGNVLNWPTPGQVNITAQYSVACFWTDGARWVVTNKFL